MAHGGEEVALGALGGAGFLGQFQLAGHRFAGLGDVLDLRDEMERLVLAVAGEGDVEVDPDDVAVLVMVALLHVVGGGAAFDEVVDVAEVGVEVLGVGEVLEGEAGEFLGLVTDDFAERAVDLEKATRERDERDAVGGVLEGAGEAFLA